MAELIISLSGWILITSILVPFYFQLHNQFIQLEEKSDALHLFYEYLQNVIVEDADRENIVLTKGEKDFFIVWYGDEQKEVMIRYEDLSGKMVEIHETTP